MVEELVRVSYTSYGRMMSKFQHLYGQNHNPNPNNRHSFKMPEKLSFFGRKMVD